MTNATAELNTTTISRIIDFLENVGVVATCVTPQEILDHVNGKVAAEREKRASEAKQITRWEEEYQAAAAIDCGHEACDGGGHEAVLAPENWSHRIALAEYGQHAEAVVEIHARKEGFVGYVCLDSDNEHDSAGLRKLASELDELPAALRAFADQLDEGNAATV